MSNLRSAVPKARRRVTRHLPGPDTMLKLLGGSTTAVQMLAQHVQICVLRSIYCHAITPLQTATAS